MKTTRELFAHQKILLKMNLKDKDQIFQIITQNVGDFNYFLSSLPTECFSWLSNLGRKFSRQGIIGQLSWESQCLMQGCKGRGWLKERASDLLKQKSEGWVETLSRMLFADSYGVMESICRCWEQVDQAADRKAILDLIRQLMGNETRHYPLRVISASSYLWLCDLSAEEFFMAEREKEKWWAKMCVINQQCVIFPGKKMAPAFLVNPQSDREKDDLLDSFTHSCVCGDWREVVEMLCEQREWVFYKKNEIYLPRILKLIMEAVEKEKGCLQALNARPLSPLCTSWLCEWEENLPLNEVLQKKLLSESRQEELLLPMQSFHKVKRFVSELADACRELAG